ncbi:MAG: hypothetical protein JSS25_05140 [Proteobacteria bacterium]|nr:hypothetical protein [Pseudomonadota bacterium]
MGSAAAKEKPQVAADLAGTHGFVFVEAPKGGLGALYVKSLASGDGAIISTPVGAPTKPAAEQFGYWLLPGRYKVTGWPNHPQADGPEFEVEAGRVTDLGSMVPVNLGGYEVVLLPVRHPENENDLETAIAPIKALLKNPEPIRWNASSVPAPATTGQRASGLGLIADLLLAYDHKVNKPSTIQHLKDEKDPKAFLQIARTVMPPLQDEPALAPDGTAWFPADLGTLRRRTPDGHWDSVNIDTLRQILAVEYDQGRLLAGSDDGHIRLSSDNGAHWSELKTLAPLESVIDIDHGDGTWIVVTTEKFSDPNAPRGGGLVAAMPGTQSVHMRMYSGKRDDLSDLALSKEFTLTPKDQIGWMGARGQLFNGKYYVNAGNALERLDITSGTWTLITPGDRVSTHYVDPKTGTLSAFWSQGAFSKVFLSMDGGDHWNQIGRPSYVIIDVQMNAPDRGWASRMNMGAFSGTWETYSFVQSKNDWDKTGEAPFSCRPMRYSADTAPICITTGASILGLHDGKWEVEFSAN